MTITKYDGVAILPKRCDICNRLFWLESYNIFYKTVLVGIEPIKHIECKNCMKGETDMEEVYTIWNSMIFNGLKDRVNSYVIVKTDMDNDRFFISISDFNIRPFYARIEGLEERMAKGNFDAEQEVNGICRSYKNYILAQYFKSQNKQRP